MTRVRPHHRRCASSARLCRALQLASVVDGVLVIARAGQTDRKAVATVIGTLRRLRANVLGVVLNEVSQRLATTTTTTGITASTINLKMRIWRRELRVKSDSPWRPLYKA